ncbi:MAG TPA: aldose epimerase [Rhodanobacteraceae bacterium]|nr:aldose epimerase [Rhodanobacteraceae bacterium]
MTFSSERDQFDGRPVVVLCDEAQGRRVRIACRGATLLNFEVSHAGSRHDLADGYRSGDEIDAHPGSRFAVMCPFANRIADARYRFDGEEHDLQPGVPEGQRGIMHGLVREAEFDIETLEHDAASASTTLATTIAPRPGYPFTIELAVCFRLGAGGLSLEACMRNRGQRPAPCFFGWHPYLRLGGASVNRWQLQLAARQAIQTDARLIPLPGDAARVALDTVAPAMDFRRARAIGDAELDQGYAGREADADGRLRSILSDPASGLAVAMWQARGVTLVYTADTVQRPRQSVALEPMEAMTDAFNRADCADAIRLEPGAERRFRCGIELLAGA